MFVVFVVVVFVGPTAMRSSPCLVFKPPSYFAALSRLPPSPFIVCAEQDEGVPLPKCKHEKSRDLAFKLLNELASGCRSNLELVRHFGVGVGRGTRSAVYMDDWLHMLALVTAWLS